MFVYAYPFYKSKHGGPKPEALRKLFGEDEEDVKLYAAEIMFLALARSYFR